MTTEELEQLLEGGTETPRLDYKGPCSWDIKSFAKDILALANIEDGGWIVIGMDEVDGGFQRVGVTDEQAQSFNIDTMRDQFSPFPDPHVSFFSYIVSDKNASKFVVMKINEFEEIPVISIKDSIDTKAAVIYYRNSDKKVESGPISNYHDLRNLIERSAIKIRKRWQELGLEIPEHIKKRLEEELRDLI